MATNAPQDDTAQRQNHQGPLASNQLHDILAGDASRGAAVHSFSPEASPKAKAAAASEGLENRAGTDVERINAGDVSVTAGNGRDVLPSINVEDVDKVREDKLEHPAPLPPTPGGYPSGPAPVIPDWYKIGWRAVANIDAPPLEEGEEKDKSILGLFLREQFYGAWYHNAALIFFAVIASHFLTRFNLGWGWLFILLAICNTYYVNSMSRVRRRARDDIQRELVKTRLASEHESAEWLNHFLNRFWLIYEPVLSATMVASVDQVLSTNTPAFLDSLRLTTFTLGTKAPRIQRVRTFPNTEEDIVLMDWEISFTPNDVSDLTPRQAAQKVNPKIVLSVRIGKGLATAAVPVLIEDISFSGLMRVRMKLVSNFPHIQIVDLSFLGRPVFDYTLKPVGGETFGFDIAHIPGLSEFIREMVHATIGPMMYEPNVFTLNLEQLLSGAPLDAAIGAIQLTVHAARGLKSGKIGGGSPDPFVSISINNRQEFARTKYRHSTYNPTWIETKFILVNSLQEQLVLTVLDYNERRKPTSLGAALFEMHRLVEDAVLEDVELPILKDGKDRGQIRFDVSYYPVLKPQIVDGQERLPETNVGIVRLTLHQAKELDASKSLSAELNPFVKVYLGSDTSPIHKSQIIKHTNNPVWESSTEFLCSDKHSSMITVNVVDERDFLKDPVVGYMSVRLEDLLRAEISEGRDWWPLSKTGKLRMSAQWKPLYMAGALSGVAQYVPPIGVVRLWLQKATDVKNVEAALGGKSDPYVRVLVNNVIEGRTEVINNNLNPVWDQIIYIPVHSLRESLFMEVMDYQNMTKDRSLGSVELQVNDLVRESSTDPQFRHESTGRKEVTQPIQLDGENTLKGHLHFVAEFIPALALKHVGFDAGENEIQKAAKAMNGVAGGDVAADTNGSSSSLVLTQTATVDRPVTELGTHAPKPSLDTHITDVSQEQEGPEKDDDKQPSGLELDKEQLLKHQSGIIIFNILSGKLQRKARLEVLLDDGYWPAFSTIKARSTHAMWQHVGEGVIKELDFGRVWLRLNESADGDKDDIIAEWKGDAKLFLQTTLDRRESFFLTDVQDESKISTVEIEARYVPIPLELEPRESINTADKGGKSDPYAVFTLNGCKVFKSQTKKKTLHPDWSENFTVNVPSRVAADFSVEVFDWNQLEQSKSLGAGRITLDDLEPFESMERVVNLSTEKHGEKGQVYVRLTFAPEIIAKARKTTSTFSAAGRAMTQLGALPMGAGKGVIHGIHGVGGIFKKDFLHHDKSTEPLVPPTEPLPERTEQTSNSARESAVFPSTESGHSGTEGPPSEPGSLRVVVLSAKDLPGGEIKPYATLRVGDREFKTKHGTKTAAPEWNESFIFAASARTPKLHVWVYDHKTLGKDKLIAEGEVDVRASSNSVTPRILTSPLQIWSHIIPRRNNMADVSLALRETGQLHLRLEFDGDTNPNHHDASTTERHLASPSRFSIRGRRPDDG
ncbi:C2 domain-containing protein [Boletus reticuloceps]|uniref:C2 domain-containing protein n=1 Tax=Boletus reticuloceps TaxID=495285 RepID=A0A8I2YH55_9AGAM|nr:C2 domain-containing protein [Boletus reticuloceps]